MKVDDKFVIVGNGSADDTEVRHWYDIGTVVTCIDPMLYKYEANGVEVVNVSGPAQGLQSDLEQQVEPRHLQAIN